MFNFIPSSRRRLCLDYQINAPELQSLGNVYDESFKLRNFFLNNHSVSKTPPMEFKIMAFCTCHIVWKVWIFRHVRKLTQSSMLALSEVASIEKFQKIVAKFCPDVSLTASSCRNCSKFRTRQLGQSLQSFVLPLSNDLCIHDLCLNFVFAKKRKTQKHDFHKRNIKGLKSCKSCTHHPG